MTRQMRIQLPLGKREATRLLLAIDGPSCNDKTLAEIYYRLKAIIEIGPKKARSNQPAT